MSSNPNSSMKLSVSKSHRLIVMCKATYFLACRPLSTTLFTFTLSLQQNRGLSRALPKDSNDYLTAAKPARTVKPASKVKTSYNIKHGIVNFTPKKLSKLTGYYLWITFFG